MFVLTLKIKTFYSTMIVNLKIKRMYIDTRFVT